MIYNRRIWKSVFHLTPRYCFFQPPQFDVITKTTIKFQIAHLRIQNKKQNKNIINQQNNTTLTSIKEMKRNLNKQMKHGMYYLINIKNNNTILQDPIAIIMKQVLEMIKNMDNNRIMKNLLENKVQMGFINNIHIEVIVIPNNFQNNKWKKCKDKLKNL
ncbi:unnamed protein product [Paramecium primaurelia]|uniref:Uncharacterized protein n=1 Tax=Paramecium primaurelia TaxID=5886 RepID=A0A8S1K420_PARPR|nr:unnamed protein product [Paramecium primaurelia]